MKKEYNEDFYRWWLEFNMRWFNNYVYPILNSILAMLIKGELSGKKYGTTKSFESSLLKYHNLVFFYLVFLHHSTL